MKRLSPQERAELRQAYPDDPRIFRLVGAYEQCEELLRRSLYEFGSELRGEIERFLGEQPLIPPGR